MTCMTCNGDEYVCAECDEPESDCTCDDGPTAVLCACSSGDDDDMDDEDDDDGYDEDGNPLDDDMDEPFGWSD